MRVYINHLNLKRLDAIHKNIEKLTPYAQGSHSRDCFVKTERFIELYTDAGIFQIDDKNCYRFIIEDAPLQFYPNYTSGIDGVSDLHLELIVDPSKITKQRTMSVCGKDHVAIEVVRHSYKLTKNATFHLVIVTNPETLEYIDMYFEGSSDKELFNPTDPFDKADICVFLSALN